MSKYCLSDIAEFITEKIDLNAIKLEQYISTDNMLPDFNGIILSTTEPSLNKCTKFQKGDILFSNIRTYFKKVWFADFEGGCSPDVIVIRSRNKELVLPEFLYLLICSDEFINFTIMSSNGAKMPRGDKKAMLKYEFDIPTIEEQKIASKYYFMLKEKIQLNTQINQTLEQIAQAIFKSWFIDFDPVRAKAEALAEGKTQAEADRAAMEIISGKNPEELDRLQAEKPEQYQQLLTLAQAFPNEFEEVEGVGEVPKGWEYGILANTSLKIQNGGTPKRSNIEYWENGSIPWLSSGEVCNKNILVQSKEFITKLGLSNSSAKLVPKNSTLIAIYASPTAGKCSFCAFESTTNQAVCSVIPKPIYQYFNYYYLRTMEEYYANQAVGSAQQNISKAIVENTPILIPNEEVLNNFNTLVKSLMERQIENLKQNLTLEKTRDLLLPKLLSGEVLL